MAEEKEAFVDRWSRLKKKEQVAEAAPPPAQQKQEDPPAPLPPVADLTPESDFKPFMDPRVDPGTRRDALKALFTDSHFKTIDPFEPYSIDLTGEDPIPEAMLKTLNHARRLLFDEKEIEKIEQIEQIKEQAEAKPLPADKDVPGKQDA
jgi:hypothetical protein